METVAVAGRIRGALWGLFVGDALAMPVHWYYDTAALRRDYGVVRDFAAPHREHPGSIMSLASTGRAGRGTQEGEVVGSVILKGRKHLWCEPNIHYHHGLRAGDNTLNLLCARILLRSLVVNGRHDPAGFLRDYVAFMTEPDTHGDTYAESYHRDFFANFARGLAPDRCAGAEGHDTASIGGLVSLPLVILAAHADPGRAEAELLAQLRLTHRSRQLERYALALGRLLLRLVSADGIDADRMRTLACETAAELGTPVASWVERALAGELSDLEVIGRRLSPACYIDQSFPAVLYLAARYAGDFEGALVANTNVGGDNCHRGAVLGAILGAAHGMGAIPPRWLAGLAERAALETEIEAFTARFA
jgi:ADP-ribosyl-[dinitrogen reductase] hydrolase